MSDHGICDVVLTGATTRKIRIVSAIVAVLAAVVVRTLVFVENAHARPRLQEPPGLEIGGCLHLGGYLFFGMIFGTPFFFNGNRFGPNMAPT